MVDLRLMVANLKFIFLICFQQETLADGIVPTNVNVLIIELNFVTHYTLSSRSKPYPLSRTVSKSRTPCFRQFNNPGTFKMDVW